jgi:hypothetical protein
MAAQATRTKSGGVFVRTTGKGVHGDRRTKRNRTRGAQKRRAISEG